MIYDYEILKHDKEEVLFLYLDFDREFAKLKGKAKKNKLSGMVNSFIKEKGIKFNGQKIAIVMGGVIVATLVAARPLVKPASIKGQNNAYSIALVSEDVNWPPEQVKENIVQEGQKEKAQSQESVAKKENKETKVIKKGTSNTGESKSTTSVNNQTSKQEEIQDDKTYVTIKSSSGLITLELEEYIIGVVGAEMPASFNSEALKAQAVIARTYALKAIKTGKELTDDSSTQNYKNVGQLQKMWGSSFNTYYNKIKSAVDSTKGLYLTYEGEIIEALYHSTSNGKTEDSKNVWGNAYPYLISVESPYDETNKSFLSSMAFTYEELTIKLGMEVTVDTNFTIISKTDGDRVAKINIGSKEFKGIEIRSLLGLRSADFTVDKDENKVTFTTKGYGHGVGMSQYGANGMANHGSSYEAILKHYYPKVELTYKS